MLDSDACGVNPLLLSKIHSLVPSSATCGGGGGGGDGASVVRTFHYFRMHGVLVEENIPLL
jgi:hypothetical protein